MFAVLLVGLALAPIRLIVNKLTTWLGKISYSVYLVHTPVIVYLIPKMRSIQEAIPSYTGAYFLMLIMVMGFVIPIATLTYYLIENPLNEFGKRQANKFAGRRLAFKFA